MATNKLMEAAAEILAGSKKSASAMPMQKPEGAGVQDLGGPTPQDGKPMDNSNKIDATKGAKSATAPTTKPSAASSDTQNHPAGGTKTMREDEEYDEDQLDEVSLSTASKVYRKRAENAHRNDTIKNDNKLGRSADVISSRFGMPGRKIVNKIGKEYDDRNRPPEHREATEYEDDSLIEELRAQMHEDIQALFSDDETISEDFKIKAATIFEARVFDRVAQIQEEIESEYAGMLEEAVEQIKSDLTEKVDDYLNYVVEQWMEENQIAIESGLRSEITEDFIAGLRNLFAENYINVPEDKVDLVEELASKVEELETKLNEEIETNIEYKKALTEAIKEQLTSEVCEGLTATQVEKIKSLAESVDFSTEEEFKEKLETLRENYFPSGIQKANVSHLQEQFEDTEEKKVIHDPFISAVSQAISKTKI
jgi:hypothetical protein